MVWETVTIEGGGPVRHLVFNRPRVHNAVNPQFIFDVHDACLAIEQDPTVRVVIVRGEGKSFSSGGDLKEDPTLGPVSLRMHRSKSGARLHDVLTNLRPITIAAMHGHAIGAGAVLGLACDFRIGGESLSVCINEVSIGLNLTWSTLPALVRVVGPDRAREMVILGRAYNGRQMLACGFLNELVPDGDLVAAAEAMAAEVVRQPPVPAELAKASVNAYALQMGRALHHMDHLAHAYTGTSRNSRLARAAYFSEDAPAYVDE